jgi:AmmeMemoRadiSam system protein B
MEIRSLEELGSLSAGGCGSIRRDRDREARRTARLPPWRALFMSALFAVACLGGAKASADDRTPFASMYADPKPFLAAIARERGHAAPQTRVTGISVPHHLLAADLIARGLQAASGNRYDRVIILSPDHFNRSRRPMATTRRDIETVFGPLQNDRAATGALLRDEALFDDSGLFAKEHGIAALLPFVRHFFPDAKIVPIAISYDASRADCDRALALVEQLIGPRTLVVQSTDYSHYLPADVARQRDQETLNIIAGNDADAVLRLVQPAHMDSRASQYMQMQLQGSVFKSYATVVANRNSAEYSAIGAKTTSYIVTVYTERPPTGAELRYPDLETLYFGGDTFIGRYFTAPFADKDVAASIVSEIKAVTGGAPLIVNLEGAILDEPPEGIGLDRHAMYASLAVPVLKALNVKVAGLANNHSFDLGAVGFEETRAILQRSGIAPLAHKEIVDVGPFRLLALNFIAKLDYHDYPVVKDNDLDKLCGMKARPPLLALVHWGHEYTTSTGTAEYAAAQAMQACGVSAIVGAHPHQAAPRIEAMQGGEYQLTYSLGNLLFDQTADRGSGALLELRAFKQGTYATRLIRIPNLFEVGVERLQTKQGLPVKSPETNSAGSR